MKYNLNLMEKTLENGMRVILVHKKGFEKSLFLCGIPAGGLNILEEQDGQSVRYRTGIAHFLEHQMFRLNGEDVTDTLALLQSQSNAYTGYTETAYYFTTTADPIEPLKLFLEFVQTLDIDEASVEKEKGIILSELNMYIQQPESRLIWETLRSLYRTHGLRTEILGDVQDIEEMQVKDLTDFYAAHYDPSKLVLIGITGKELDPILETVETMEQQFPSRKNQTVQRILTETDPTPARKEYTIEMDVQKPYVSVAFKMDPAENTARSLLIDGAVSLWLDAVFGPMNPAYQSWIDDHIISGNAGAEADFSTENGYIIFYAQTGRIKEFVNLVQNLVQEKKMDPQAFKALQIQSIARNLRSLDNFEMLACDLLHAKFEGYDFIESMDLVRGWSVQTIEEVLQALDFSRMAVTQIVPENPEKDA